MMNFIWGLGLENFALVVPLILFISFSFQTLILNEIIIWVEGFGSENVAMVAPLGDIHVFSRFQFLHQNDNLSLMFRVWKFRDGGPSILLSLFFPIFIGNKINNFSLGFRVGNVCDNGSFAIFDLLGQTFDSN